MHNKVTTSSSPLLVLSTWLCIITHLTLTSMTNIDILVSPIPLAHFIDLTLFIMASVAWIYYTQWPIGVLLWPRGGVLTLTWYTYMCLPFGSLFHEIWYSDRGFSSETKEPKLHKLGVFWANYCKKHPIWSKLGVFLSKMVYWWVGNLAKNWYRDSQIFEVRQAHPRTILVKEPPPPGLWLAHLKYLLLKLYIQTTSLLYEHTELFFEKWGFISEWNYRKKISCLGTFFENSLEEFTIGTPLCLKMLQECCQKL